MKGYAQQSQKYAAARVNRLWIGARLAGTVIEQRGFAARVTAISLPCMHRQAYPYPGRNVGRRPGNHLPPGPSYDMHQMSRYATARRRMFHVSCFMPAEHVQPFRTCLIHAAPSTLKSCTVVEQPLLAMVVPFWHACVKIISPLRQPSKACIG